MPWLLVIFSSIKFQDLAFLGTLKFRDFAAVCLDAPGRVSSKPPPCSLLSTWSFRSWSFILSLFSPQTSKKYSSWSPCCGIMGWVVSLQPQDAGLIPRPAQRAKDPVVLWLPFRSQLCLHSDPWTGNSKCHAVAKKEEKKKKYVSFCYPPSAR